MPITGWWEVLWADPAKVLCDAGLKPGMDAVDLCSGNGWFTLQIAKIARPVVAVDIDRSLVEVARRRLSERGVTNCDFVTGDACRLSRFCPAPVDFVFMANAFHGVPDKQKLVRSVRDALKAGGRFAIVNWHKRPREETIVLGEPRGPRTDLRVSPQQTIDAAKVDGVEIVTSIDVPPFHYAVILQRE